jgi:hypothetical protein
MRRHPANQESADTRSTMGRSAPLDRARRHLSATQRMLLSVRRSSLRGRPIFSSGEPDPDQFSSSIREFVTLCHAGLQPS